MIVGIFRANGKGSFVANEDVTIFAPLEEAKKWAQEWGADLIGTREASDAEIAAAKARAAKEIEAVNNR